MRGKCNPKCTAKARNAPDGVCKNYAMDGQKVCPMHGGKAPQNLAAAKRRLLEMVDPALAVLSDAMTPKMRKEQPIAAIRAAENVMDRVGLKTADEVVITEGTALADRLRRKRQQRENPDSEDASAPTE